MKTKSILLFLCLLFVARGNSQLNLSDFYEEPGSLLIYSEVHEFENISHDDINTRVKNWAGTNFVNMREVLVSETKDQMVFNYITSSFFIKILGMPNSYKWYVRLVVQTKENKVRLLFYDDGNAFWPGTYTRIGNSFSSTPSVPARRYRLRDYFKKDGTSRKTHEEGLTNFKTHCVSSSKSVSANIKMPNQIENSPNKDW